MQYRNELISENDIVLRCIKLLEPAIVKNKRFTSGINPKTTVSVKNACWTDQWRALSENYAGRCQCASCGKLLFANTSDPECIKLAQAYNKSGNIPGCTPEALQIQGAHVVLIKNIVDRQYLLAKKGSTFIVPLCKECNNSNVVNLKIRYGTILTPEIK